MGFLPKGDPSPNDPSEMDRTPRPKQWSFDSFGRTIFIGDSVMVTCGIYINRSGDILDIDTVEAVDVLAIHIPTEGVRIVRSGHVRMNTGFHP